METPAKGYRDLLAWQKSMELCEIVYASTESLPEHERFGLTSQMRRAAVSIPSNIAEGHGRRQTKDYAKHLRYALGSLAELETQLELTVRCGLLSRDAARPVWSVAQEVGKLLTRLYQSQQSTPSA
ncbi:MAG: four helix bundle protein [Planctomycetota bacterium]